MLGVGHALRRSCAAWRAAAPSLPGRNREPLASAWQLLGERAFAVDAEHARRRAQESAQKLRGADAGADAPSGSGAVDVFDRQVKTQQRERAAWLAHREDPLHEEVTERLLERLEDIKREFPVVLVLGGAHGAVARRICSGRAAVRKLLHIDSSRAQLDAAAKVPVPSGVERVFMCADEERLPLEHASVDLVVSCLGLHWLNDLPGTMVQCRRALRPDGLFLSAFLGGGTLNELRIACAVGEQEREGGISPRVSPLAHVRDAGNLLGRAGLTLPAVDTDTITVQYESVLDLVAHLRATGETNAVRARRRTLRRDTALASAAIYDAMFAEGEDKNRAIPATFQVIYMAGWAPHSSQQQAKRRGSATVSLSDLAKHVGGDDA